MTRVPGTDSFGDRLINEMNAALRERERTDADLRKAITKLLAHHHEADLTSAASTAYIRARVARVRYAAALEAAGWEVPEHLLDDTTEHDGTRTARDDSAT